MLSATPPAPPSFVPQSYVLGGQMALASGLFIGGVGFLTRALEGLMQV